MADVVRFPGEGRPKKGPDPDRTMTQQGLPSSTELTRAEKFGARGEAAAALRVAGAPYSEIAAMLEYSSAFEARRAVEQILASTVDESKDYQSLRAVESIRLEGLYRAVAPRALDENDEDQLAFHRAALSVLDRIAKLHGLDAPTRVELTTPGAAEFDRVLGMLRTATDTGGGELELDELDVVDAEWEEGDEDDEGTGLAGAGRVEADEVGGREPTDRVPIDS